MTQDEIWIAKCNEVKAFIETNQRNPSKHDAEERGLYWNWLHHNKKRLNAGLFKPERVALFSELLKVSEQYRHKNQYE